MRSLPFWGLETSTWTDHGGLSCGQVSLNWIYMRIFSAGDVRHPRAGSENGGFQESGAPIWTQILGFLLEGHQGNTLQYHLGCSFSSASLCTRLDMTGKTDRRLLRYVVFSRSLANVLASVLLLRDADFLNQGFCNAIATFGIIGWAEPSIFMVAGWQHGYHLES